MRLVVLTTQTPHHARFVEVLAAQWPIRRVYLETEPLQAPFETAHPFEAERDVYECRLWFGGAERAIESLAETRSVRRMNDADAVARLRAEEADIVVVFGTAKLSVDVIGACPDGMINLHGGNPETHRGLDTHLWAVREGTFGALETCLHRVAPTLDAGDIIAMRPLAIPRAAPLYALRRFNTDVCCGLVLEALALRARSGGFAARPQTATGRWYSFMPSADKAACVEAFRAWTADRPGPAFDPEARA